MDIQRVNWPDGANCAVMLTFNLDADQFWMSLGDDCHRRPKTLSLGEYGMKRGLHRVLDVLEAFDVPATFFVPGKVAEHYPDRIQEVAAGGFEIGLHGYAHENFGHLNDGELGDAFSQGVAALKKVTGENPMGFRVPEGEMTREAYDHMAASGILYSSSMFGDDRPYWVKTALEGKSVLEIPAPWEISDFPYFGFNYTPAFPAGQGRIANYSHVLSTFKQEYKAYYYYGLCYVPQFDPQTIGSPGRITILADLLKYIKEQGKVWFCTGREMADFWDKN